MVRACASYALTDDRMDRTYCERMVEQSIEIPNFVPSIVTGDDEIHVFGVRIAPYNATEYRTERSKTEKRDIFY